MKTLTRLICAAALGAANLFSLQAMAQSPTPATASAPVGMTAAEVRKVDIDNKKITLKHEEIKNLDMPAMTMVFQVDDAALLAKLKAGDKVQFKARHEAGKYTVTELVPVR